VLVGRVALGDFFAEVLDGALAAHLEGGGELAEVDREIAFEDAELADLLEGARLPITRG